MVGRGGATGSAEAEGSGRGTTTRTGAECGRGRGRADILCNRIRAGCQREKGVCQTVDRGTGGGAAKGHGQCTDKSKGSTSTHSTPLAIDAGEVRARAYSLRREVGERRPEEWPVGARQVDLPRAD